MFQTDLFSTNSLRKGAAAFIDVSALADGQAPHAARRKTLQR